jgi:hypothetical protein
MTESRPPTQVHSSLGGVVDALDTIIGSGAVVAGDVVIALNGIDLIRLDLRLLLTGIAGEPATTSEAA